MTIAEYSINRRVTVIMVTLGLIVVGVISFLRLPQELFPPITFPQVTVVTDYINAAPEEIETLITRPLEESIGSVAGLKRVESISREGRSTIIISFNWGQDIDFAALAVREKIDLVKERLPKEAEDPVVLKFDPLSRPILILSVNAPNMPPVQMKILTEKLFKDNLEKVEGVASASLSGGVNREIVVDVDQARLQANHLSLLDIIQSIEDANVSYPAGSIKKGLYEYLIRTVGEFRSVKEIEYAVAGVDTVEKVKREQNSFVEQDQDGPRETLDSFRAEVASKMLEKRLVLIRDIASVTDGTAERTSISRYNGNENISIAIQKQANANTIQVVDRVKEALEFLKRDADSKGLHYDIIYDHSIFIRRSLENLFHEALSGGFLAFLVLFGFLKSFRSALLVIISIPITIVGVYFMMGVAGITLNIMSLGGLALAVGMIVDTGIVVIENVFRRRQLGDSPVEGAIRGTNEVMSAVISSNMTTIAVFFPLVIFVPGILGQIIKDLSWTVIFSQVVSTIIPLTLIAMLSVYVKPSNMEYKPINWVGKLERFVSGAQTSGDLQRRTGQVVGYVFALVFAAILLIMPTLDREVLPKVDQGQFIIKVDMPIGTRLEVTSRVSQRLEKVIRKEPEVKNISITVGAEKSKQGEVKIETLRESQALVLITLEEKRKRSSAEVMQSIRDNLNLSDLESALLDFVLQESEFQFAEGGVKPILIEVKGYDFTMLRSLADGIKNKLREIPGVFSLQDDMGEPSPETKLDIDKRRAALYGISALDISLTAKAAIEGVIATQYRESGKEFDVRVRLDERDRKNVDNLNQLLLYSKVLDALIPLKEVAGINRGVGPSEIRRVNQDRTVTISGDILKEYKSKDVLNQVQRTLAEFKVPPDAQVVLSGKAREIKENFSLVSFAFILSVLLIYMIMAAQFESFLQPLIIMVTVPLSFVGILVALWLTGTSLNVISLLGVVMLGGVVVNNGIVLLEAINQLCEEGMDYVAAALESAKIRTRPILMSALTTVVGLVPLALGFGEGSELRRPLAITVMGGLISSTFLTLFVIPSLYILVTSWTSRFYSGEEDDFEDLPADEGDSPASNHETES